MISSDEIKQAIIDHKAEIVRYKTLYNYYKSKSEITKRQLPDPEKPNNKIATSYCHSIIETVVGYFASRPVSYISKSNDEEYLELVNDILFENSEHDINAEHVKFFSIFGLNYELVYIGTDGKLKFNYYTPLDMYVKKDRHGNVLYGLRYWESTENGKDIVEVELYDDKATHFLKSINDSDFEKYKESKTHIFNEVPINLFLNNTEEVGDFEKQIPLIDAIDKLLSDTSNEIEAFANAYLLLKGYSGTTNDEIQKLKQDGVLLLDADGEAKWLIKDADNTFQKDYFEVLDQLIHDQTGTPKMTSEEFSSNISGAALRNKLFALESKSAVKERKMERALRNRLKLITKYINYMRNTNYDHKDIRMTFVRNVHQDTSSVTDQIVKLIDIVDHETLLSWHPNIEEPSQIIKKLKEQKDTMDLDRIGQDRNE